MSLIIKAAQLAHSAHAGQKRKFTGRPYIEHPARVASKVTLLSGVTEIQVAAAWLHDVVEDCDITPTGLVSAGIPQAAVDLVCELTNPSKGSRANRAARKRQDREHIAKASYWARVLKMLDRIDNLQEIDPEDGFTELYVVESQELADAIRNASDEPVFIPLYLALVQEIEKLAQ